MITARSLLTCESSSNENPNGSLSSRNSLSAGIMPCYLIHSYNLEWAVIKGIILFTLGRLGAVDAENVNNGENVQFCRSSNRYV